MAFTARTPGIFLVDLLFLFVLWINDVGKLVSDITLVLCWRHVMSSWLIASREADTRGRGIGNQD